MENKKRNRDDGKKLALVISISLAVAILSGSVIAGGWFGKPLAIAASTGGSLTADQAKDFEAKHPNAVKEKGDVKDVLKGVALNQVEEITEGERLDAIEPGKVHKDKGNVVLKMHYKNGDTDTLAVTIKNAGSNDITLENFVIAGYLPIFDPRNPDDHGGSYVLSMYRPIIAPPTDIAGGISDEPEILPAAESITAYIQEEIDAEGFIASACYAYDPADANTYFCVSTPMKWLK